MESSRDLAHKFLTGLTQEERTALYNDLLALQEVHLQNSKASFYTFRKLRRASHRHFECRKRTLRFVNIRNEELVIHQIHEQRVFKNKYRIQVFFNLQEYNYLLIEDILASLQEQKQQLEPAVAYA